LQSSRATGRQVPSSNVRQQLLLDSTLPTPASFHPSAMITSTPAVMEEKQEMSHDVGAVHDGSYLTVPKSMCKCVRTSVAASSYLFQW